MSRRAAWRPRKSELFIFIRGFPRRNKGLSLPLRLFLLRHRPCTVPFTAMEDEQPRWALNRVDQDDCKLSFQSFLPSCNFHYFCHVFSTLPTRIANFFSRVSLSIHVDRFFCYSFSILTQNDVLLLLLLLLFDPLYIK